MKSHEYEGRLSTDIGESRRFVQGCCLGLLISVPMWACIIVCLIGLIR